MAARPTLLGPAQLAELKRIVPDGRGGAYGLGVERRDLPCPNGTVPVWGNIAAELADRPPFPAANPMPALVDTFCWCTRGR